MDKTIAAKIEGIFAKRNQIADAAQREKDARDLETARFRDDFIAKRDAVYRPILEGFAEAIVAQGFKVRVLTEQQISAVLRRDGFAMLGVEVSQTGNWHRPDTPTFGLHCDSAGKSVYFSVNTIGLGHGGTSGASGKFQLEDVTEEVFASEVLKWMEKVFVGNG